MTKPVEPDESKRWHATKKGKRVGKMIAGEGFSTVCDTPGCTTKQAKDYRFCDKCMKDRYFEQRWGKTKEQVEQEMDERERLQKVYNYKPQQATVEDLVREAPAATTIFYMKGFEDLWIKALNILYGE